MKYIEKLTKEQEKSMKAYADKWIKIGLKTGKTDFDTFDKYMPTCYEKAGLKYPKNIVRVKSPLIGALVSSIASKIIKQQTSLKKGDAVGDAIRDAVRDAVGDAVGSAVSDAVDYAVRDAVGDAVGSAVSGAVRDAVHGAVGDAVGGAGLQWHYWLGGQFWVGGWYWGVAYVNFFFDKCNLKPSKDIMERAFAYRKVCESVNYIWLNDSFVIVCERPTRIEKNDNNQLHSLTDMAIKYPDGWGLYMIDGVRFEKEWWEKIKDDKLSAEEVFAIDNLEHRRIAYKYMDKNKMKQLKNYKVLDTVKNDGYGKKMQIVSFNVQNMDEDLIFLNCFCPTTNREYYIQTKEKDCWSAKAQSFGLNKDDITWDKEY